MKTQNDPSKNGGILLMAMLMVLLFSILTIGLYKLFDTDAMETVSVEHHRRAFWMAEMGLEKVVDRLAVDVPFRNSPVSYTIYLANKSFSNASCVIESITSVLAPLPVVTGRVYTVVSRGTVGGISRRIQQEILVRPGNGALRSQQGNLRLASNDSVDGNIILDAGNLTVEAKESLNPNNPSGVDGYAIVGGSVEGKYGDEVSVIEGPPPPPPKIDMTHWMPFLNGVTNNANTNGLAGVSLINITTGVANYDYSDTATTMESDSSLKLDIDGTASGLNGLHYFVSATSVIFHQSTELKDNTVVIVNGNITFDQNVTFGNNCTVFAFGDIYVRQSSDAGGTGVTLLARGNVTFDQNMVFHGFVLAGGKLAVGQNSSIEGSFNAIGDITIDQNVEITFNPDVFQKPMHGVDDVAGSVNLLPSNWMEIAPR